MSRKRTDTFVFISSRTGARLGRVERRLLEVIKALVAQGASVHVIGAPRGPMLEPARELGAQIAPFGVTRVGAIQSISRVRAYLRSVEPQIAHSSGWFADYLLRQAAGSLPVKVVNSIDCVAWPPSGGTALSTSLYRALDRSNLERADAIVIDCVELGEPLVNAGIELERIFYDPPSVDLGRVQDEAGLLPVLRLPGHAPHVGYAGALERSRGLAVLAQATAILGLRRATATVVVAGDGPAQDELADAIAAKRLYLLNHPKSVPAILRQLDVCVFPLLEPGTPTTLLEAAALGKPIVASRVMGVAGLFEEGSEIVLVQPGDAKALAAAIAGVLEDPSGARRMGERAHKRVVEECTSSASVARHLALYRKLGWE
jgi:glycosyltransferase involved in cell wall biosynthesis